MPWLTHRSYKKELLDGNDLSFADIKQNMQELDKINHLLGGHATTVQGVSKLIKKGSLQHTVSIVEIGCGGGDNLRVIKKWCAKNGIAVRLTGVDINQDCIAFAKSRKENNNIDFICSDYSKAVFATPPNIIFSSLFCHHFTDAQLVAMLQWMKQNTSTGFFINDLHRHPFAYYSILIFTKLLSRSRLVKNDAPLSVQRSFIKKEWQQLFQLAGIYQFAISWKWAFRWLIVFTHQK